MIEEVPLNDVDEAAKVVAGGIDRRQTILRQAVVSAITTGPPRTINVTVDGVSMAGIHVADYLEPVVGEGVWISDIGKGRWFALSTSNKVLTRSQFVKASGDTMTGPLTPSGGISSFAVLRQIGTTEGGQIDFEGGTSYPNSLYIDRYANDFRMIYNGAVLYNFGSDGKLSAYGSGGIGTNGPITSSGYMQVFGTAPTLVMTSTDAERSGMIHVNNNLMYFLGGAQNAGMSGWDNNGTGQWPLYLNLSNNFATFGGAASFTGNVTNNNGYFYSLGSGGGLFAKDRDGTARDAGIYMQNGIGRLYYSTYGDVLTFNSSGTVNIPIQLNLSGGVYASGGGYYGQAAGGFGAFSGTAQRAPALMSGAGTNWIHFNWDGSAFRCYVDSTLVKTFVIDHPDDSDKYLVHACAEGPTADVFYRGEARLEEGIARIDLPDYFESLTELEGRTVHITPIIEHGEAWKTANLAASRVENGCFWVFQTGGMMNNEQPFCWRVDAIRKNTSFSVEPEKASTIVGGDGPYTYVVGGV